MHREVDPSGTQKKIIFVGDNFFYFSAEKRLEISQVGRSACVEKDPTNITFSSFVGIRKTNSEVQKGFFALVVGRQNTFECKRSQFFDQGVYVIFRGGHKTLETP